MFAIYVMNTIIICLLVLMNTSAVAVAQPSATDSGADDGNTAGGSGGMASVQKRLAEGSEADGQQAKQHHPQVSKAIKQLSRTVDPASVEHAANREFITPEMPPAELAAALNSIDRFLNSAPSSAAKRALASQLLNDVAQPQRMSIGTSPVHALLQTLAYKSPGKYVQAILSKASPADTSTSVVAGRFKAGPTTPDLQQLYDRLSGTEKPLTVFKNDREFILVQPSGSLQLFADDTEYLTQELQIVGAKGASTVRLAVQEDNGYRGVLQADNGDLHLNTDIVLTGIQLIERIRIANRSRQSKSATLHIKLGSQFRDMFEVRGWRRDKRGQSLAPVAKPNALTLSYRGLDGKVLQTSMLFSKLLPNKLSDSGALYNLSLGPGQVAELQLSICPSPGTILQLDYETAKRAADEDFQKWRVQTARVETDNPQFNAMLDRGLRDLYMLKQRTAGGEAIAAGTPWFAAPFGRDQLIVSLQMLPYKPEIARNVLKLLATYQGTKTDAFKAEKPGKIMHELRIGEMARMKEIPFTPYYGTADATPLWVLLLGRYYQQTGDISLIEELRPNLDRALDFLDRETAATGYLTYGGAGKEALSNQGWKDSGDSVMYSNGELAQAPIALCEVQGYLYGAWSQAARLHAKLYGTHSARHLFNKAADLETRFDKDFWMPTKNCFALALDGQGKQVDVVSSNPGHLLITNCGRAGHLRATAKRLMEPDMFSGFGIKTLSRKEARHFDNSYHNGSVWPHDVSLIAAGLHRSDAWNAKVLADSLFAAAKYQSNMRLPELYGGYPRTQIPVPIPYPVACEPQAWAAATPFMLVTSYLGLHADSSSNTLTVNQPQLPASTTWLRLNSSVNGKQLELLISKKSGNVETQVLSNPDNVRVIIK